MAGVRLHVVPIFGLLQVPYPGPYYSMGTRSIRGNSKGGGPYIYISGRESPRILWSILAFRVRARTIHWPHYSKGKSRYR
jgi:hypothetical protein